MMLKTETFLGAFELETGGVIIGILSLVSNVLSLFSTAFAIIFVTLYGCQTFHQPGGIYAPTAMEIEKMCKMNQALMITGLVFYAMINVGFAAIALLCIRGSKNRDHIWVRPQMIVCAILTLVFLGNLFSFTAQGVIGGLVFGLIYGYFFVVLWSLYQVFRSEYESGYNVDYQAPAPSKA